MDDFMKTEAKDIISTAIEKASGATGINVEVSQQRSSLTLTVVCMQIREGLHGSSIRSMLALCHG